MMGRNIDFSYVWALTSTLADHYTVNATAQCPTIGLCSSRCKVSFSFLGTAGALYNTEQSFYKDWKRLNRMDELRNSSNNIGTAKSWSSSLPVA